MSTSDTLPSLIFMTLGITLAALIVALLMFRRRKSNRDAMEGRAERNVAADIDAGVDAKPRSPRL